ncbi:Ac154-like protein [Bombyx mandarina nucleopolyhedrovirus]|uniref:Orf154 n=2 Tax=Bombyx mori nuclear polyhedrosis virus TaxID=271108 RepID=O92505_NPVBM|nr:AcMNPV orf154 [Bombyx mori nucleopolyhedrovirus]ACQ57326.1 Ac154-like protein [Bombyx mandarina nucleopolyhedrovirus]AAC63819.1 AcMNPV orf154 [Bombyx mori nucleopolyhedrovirus]AFN21109.1 hypothetical protein Bmnpvzhejianggp136 [Bombyx mori nucleopolyhedrovirus]AFN21387.1 hypothetical protein Bmnpvguangxigp135 [Bombyx mori nucleopolyhedrovirus]AGX01224.1 orf154 [Bombyx mori nucleopolyhedrovirus]
MDSSNCIKIDVKYHMPLHYQCDINADKNVVNAYDAIDVDPNKKFIINHNHEQVDETNKQEVVDKTDATTYNSCIIKI